MKPLLLKYFLFSLFLSLPFLLIFISHFTLHLSADNPRDRYLPPGSRTVIDKGIRIRPGYKSYESYIERQLNKTLNPRLRKTWTTRDWDRKIHVFASFFRELKKHGLLWNDSKALCVGQEVEALRRVGMSDSVGIDLVSYAPLVVEGDFHAQPFGDGVFDFDFLNVFDHALYPRAFVGEIEHTLKPGGVCVLHVALTRRADKYSANDLFGVEPLVGLFGRSDVVSVRKVDGFWLDTEVVFRKRNSTIS